MNSAKEEILGRIRRSLGDASSPASAHAAFIQRGYHRAGSLDAAARVELFIDRLHDYGAGVYRCEENGIADTIAGVLRSREKAALLVPPGLPVDWLPAGFGFVVDEDLPYNVIDRSEGVLTGCAVAIALTGTIALRHSPEHGRRAITLIPDYHVCVVFEDQIAETVSEGIQKMREFALDAITTVSGPSATSDIEMTRVKGVHGPRTLDIVLVGNQTVAA